MRLTGVRTQAGARPASWLAVAAMTAAAAWTVHGQAVQVTYSRDVAPILQTKCAGCHRPGEIAPMSLLTYKDVRPWARSIKDVVSRRIMPPWGADPHYGRFANDPSLTEKEISTIARWVEQGAVEGNPKDLPPPRIFTAGWQLGEPDHVIELPEIEVPPGDKDIFPNINLALDLPEDRWVRAIEVRPGNNKVNHHVVFFMTAGSPLSQDGFFDVLVVWAAGTPPTVYPEGMGRQIRKGQRLVANMHFHPAETLEVDRTRVGLYFGEGALKKEVRAALAGTTTFEVPPGAANHQIRAAYVIDQDVRLISYFPHMHLRGKDMKFVATYPGGKRETLLSVPRYDFNWQLYYYPEEPLPLPRGTRIDIVAHYDNSAANPSNPDPSKGVRFGLESTDEMMFGVFEFIADEGIRPVSTDETVKIDALRATLPPDESYQVELRLGRRAPAPTLLHLPREGDGTWYLFARGQLMIFPVTRIAWSGNEFKFNLDLQGALGAVDVQGSLTADGKIRGSFESSGARALFPPQSFEGSR